MKRFHLFMISVLLLSLLAGQPATARAQATSYPLDNCRYGAFSTEEDFMMTEGEPYDGNPYISDGDLLGVNGLLCARNADLLRNFDVGEDLGLDAVDIVNLERRIVAFSTELDSRHGNFTAGDLLITPNTVIPNAALVAKFQINYNIGLDGIQFIGEPQAILTFIQEASRVPREQWLRGILPELLARYKVDIWFTVEGSWPPGKKYPTILDGDLLSARDGIVVLSQEQFFTAAAPAGIPQRGVDFGLDAVSAARTGDRTTVHFSTEILFNGQEISFTDGDVLNVGGAVVRAHADLVTPFTPAADFLGLDALWANDAVAREPNIQTMCGDERLVTDFDGGIVAPGSAGTGLYRQNPTAAWPAGQPRRPCGEYVPIGGFLPATGITRFRVAYREAGTAIPAPGDAKGIRTNWQLKEQRILWPGIPVCLYLGMELNTDADGWMDAAAYLGARDGTLTGCVHDELRLAVWDTNNRMGLGPADQDGHYVLWLEWEESGGALRKEGFEHHLQLDNTLPKLAPYPDGLQLRLPDGTTVVPACGETASVSQFQVWGQFEDAYYRDFWLNLRGGLPPAAKSYGPHAYYEPTDGTAGVKHTDETGTTPDGTTVYLRDIDMKDLGDSFVDCCYVLDLWVRDAAIRHSFNRRVVNDTSDATIWLGNTFITFAAAP